MSSDPSSVITLSDSLFKTQRVQDEESRVRDKATSLQAKLSALVCRK